MNESKPIQFRALRAEEVEVRVGNITANGCSLLLYKTARTDMDLLDETVGPENWQNEFYELGDKLFCRLGIRVNGEWVWKSDCGIEGNAGEEKSQASDARKRAGFAWGIGRELYRAPFIFINVPTEQRRDGKGYQLKDFPRFDVKSFEATKTEIKDLEIIDKGGNVVYRMGQTLTAARKSAKPAGQAAAPAPAPKAPIDLTAVTFDDEQPISEVEIAISDIRAARNRAELLQVNNQYKAVYGEYGSARNEDYVRAVAEMSQRYPRSK